MTRRERAKGGEREESGERKERIREGKSGMVCASCRIHSPASVKMGRTGSWTQLSRSASLLLSWPRWEWLTLVTPVNVARDINETSRMTLIRRIASNKPAQRQSICLVNSVPPGKQRCLDKSARNFFPHPFLPKFFPVFFSLPQSYVVSCTRSRQSGAGTGDNDFIPGQLLFNPFS